MPLSLHHVQIAMPTGGEARARAFYTDVLELTEVAKPDALRGRGGLWYEQANLRLHLGVEAPFHAARKAHPAFETDDLAALTVRLARAGQVVNPDADLPGYFRLYVSDPFGNRLEILQAK